uniref:Calx-beta domain-containing protein n=1 Tax=Macrostomum lignano TaxID=282301 RepID=A0A1I8IUU7_9PLAT
KSPVSTPKMSLISALTPLLSLALLAPTAEAVALDANGTCPSQANVSCKPGVVLPMWLPADNLSLGDRVARATVYLAILVYCFLGVSIIADRFMAAIEVITSKEKDVVVKLKDGSKQVVSVRIWNETVSNLTLMALGSSAPEILLSIIEICGKGFVAGDLGPGTIVGSAAFNLFIIIGFCVYVVPDGEIRRIKHLTVFFITATFSIFAYMWLYIIIAVSSPGRVTVWEGLLTFAYFPITVLLAYIADTKIFFKHFLNKRYFARKYQRDGGDAELQNSLGAAGGGAAGGAQTADGGEGADALADDGEGEFERHRHEYIELLREIRKKHPNVEPKALEEMAQIEVLNRGPKSRAFYRMQATRQLTGSGNVIKKSKVERRMSAASETGHAASCEPVDPALQRIFFDPGHYTVMENIGSFELTVSREGGDLNSRVKVDYETVNGTAEAGEDFDYAKGTLTFHSGERHCRFSLNIIDDDVFEEDEHFYVELSNIRVEGGRPDARVQLADPCRATVMVLDDDHSGVFHFEEAEKTVGESVGEAEIKVERTSGARGIVRVPYKTADGTARGGGKDFEDTHGYLEFHNDQTEQFINVRIIDYEEYQKNVFFFVELGEPILMKKVESPAGQRREDSEKGPHLEEDVDCAETEMAGRPRLGELTRVKVNIVESVEFKNTVDRMLKKANLSLVVGTSSWKEQFIEAITVSAGDGNEDEGDGTGDGEEKLPSCGDYIMHFLTIFWKLLFAFVPPTGVSEMDTPLICGGDEMSVFCSLIRSADYAGGWLCFNVSITVIGMLTAVIGDLASSFGCTVGLTDAVTAITFVALGTSLPDTFASKVAAIGDAYADSSVGNVTGSNAVNVFLGIGVAWSIAAIYHWSIDSEFTVHAGSLGFSVTLFCAEAFLAVIIMLLRRLKPIGGELGGPRPAKIATAMAFFSLWGTYILVSSLENYCYIDGF